MDISGKIISTLKKREGVSKSGTTWASQEYVLEETGTQYPQKVVFEVFGEDKIAEYNLKMGDSVQVYFNVNAREYKGNWYNQIKAWRINKNGGFQTQYQQQSTPQPQPKQSTNATPDEIGDLPF